MTSPKIMMLKQPPNGVIALTPIGPNSSKVKIKNNVELSYNDCNYGTARANVAILSGRWYWEVKIKSGSLGRIGLCTEKFQPDSPYLALGSDQESWCYDGTRPAKFHNEADSNQTQSYGECWDPGDVIGCLYDADAKTISFLKNGTNFGVAFTLTTVEELYPAASVCRGTVFEFNFSRHWQYPVKNAYPLQYQLTPNEMKSVTQLFDKYFTLGVQLSESGNTGDVIKGMGFMQLVKDLGSKDDFDPLPFILMWKFRCRTHWEIHKEEWLTGLSIFNCTTINQLKAQIEEWQKELKTSDSFISFYNFVFDYLKPEKATALDKDEALVAWKMLGMKEKWSLWDKWEKYLKEHSSLKTISKDTWRMLLSFIEKVNVDLKAYDPNDCWPLAIDEFVDYVKSNEVP